MTMIERVARAIHQGCLYPPWEQMEELARQDFLAHARRAIEAMREPTEAMLFELFTAGPSEPETSEEMRDGWRAAIDAALAEGK